MEASMAAMIKIQAGEAGGWMVAREWKTALAANTDRAT